MRKSGNIIPNLIDNKKAHLENKLSASQRDSILLAEAREDVALMNFFECIDRHYQLY